MASPFNMTLIQPQNTSQNFHMTFYHGSETSGRNRFLPRRMEETGKKGILLPLKKAEETGRNACNR